MWTIRDLGFAHRLGRWKRNPNRDGISLGSPGNGGHPVRRSGSITHWASAREHHSVLHLGWQTTKDHLPPVRTTLARSLSLSVVSALLPCAPAVVSIPNGRPWSHTHAHLQALFPLHQTNAQLASSRGYKSKLPLHRLSQPRVCHHSKHHQRMLVFKGRQFRLQSQHHSSRPSCSLLCRLLGRSVSDSPNLLHRLLHAISTHTT